MKIGRCVGSWLSCVMLMGAGAQTVVPSADGAAQTPYVETHRAMGTIFTLYVYAADAQRAHLLAQAAFEEVDRVDELLSNYKETSELSRINREAAAHAVTTDPETFGFVQDSLQWSARTGGAFDITVGQLMRAWGFFRASGRVPDAAQLKKTGEQVGWQKVMLDPVTRSVRFTQPGLELDPGGIGKGYVVDRVVALLREQHGEAALISAGGSTIYGIGAPPGTAGWKVQVPDPDHPEKALSTVMLRDTSLSTSGCTEKFFILEGHRYCHLMDPHTLRPVEGIVQTTVIDPSATASDALSASLFVLGVDGSRRLLAGMPADSAIVLAGHERVEGCAAIRWMGSKIAGSCN